MEKTEILEKLTPIVRNVFGQDDLVITDDMSAATVEAWTSLSFMQLLTTIEQEFGFKFKIFELIQIKSMGDLINSIASHC